MRRVVIVTLLVSLLALGAGCGEARIGKPAKDFTERDLSGNEISLSKYRGNVVLLDFWATWCAPCVAELPNVKRVYNKYKDDGFVVIGISLDNNRSALDAFVRKEQIEWPQIFAGAGPNNTLAPLYEVEFIPAMFLVDRDGILRYTNARGEKLEKCVKTLISVPPKG